MSEVERTLLNNCFDWVRRKLEANEGFSVLLVSAHPDGNKMTKYSLDSVEAALERCKEELQGPLKDATAYAFVYDAWLQSDGKQRPVFILQCEVRGSGTAMRLGHLYQIKKEILSSKNTIQLEGSIQLVGPQSPWLT